MLELKGHVFLDVVFQGQLLVIDGLNVSGKLLNLYLDPIPVYFISFDLKFSVSQIHKLSSVLLELFENQLSFFVIHEQLEFLLLKARPHSINFTPVVRQLLLERLCRLGNQFSYLLDIFYRSCIVPIQEVLQSFLLALETQ